MDSSNTGLMEISVNPVNDRPVMNISKDPVTGIVDRNVDLHLKQIMSTNTSPAGDLVSEILATSVGDIMTDPDAGSLEGIALTGIYDNDGKWQYLLDGQTEWNDIDKSVIEDANALLLDGNSRLRFVPNSTWENDDKRCVSFFGWDQTTGNTGDFINIVHSEDGAFSAPLQWIRAWITIKADKVVDISFSNQVDENVSASTSPQVKIGVIETNTLDEDDESIDYSFEISSQSNDSFEIDETTGEIYYKKSSTQNNISEHSVTVEVYYNDHVVREETFTFHVSENITEDYFSLERIQDPDSFSKIVTVANTMIEINYNKLDNKVNELEKVTAKYKKDIGLLDGYNRESQRVISELEKSQLKLNTDLDEAMKKYVDNKYMHDSFLNRVDKNIRVDLESFKKKSAEALAKHKDLAEELADNMKKVEAEKEKVERRNNAIDDRAQKNSQKSSDLKNKNMMKADLGMLSEALSIGSTLNTHFQVGKDGKITTREALEVISDTMGYIPGIGWVVDIAAMGAFITYDTVSAKIDQFEADLSQIDTYQEYFAETYNNLTSTQNGSLQGLTFMIMQNNPDANLSEIVAMVREDLKRSTGALMRACFDAIETTRDTPDLWGTGGSMETIRTGLQDNFDNISKLWDKLNNDTEFDNKYGVAIAESIVTKRLSDQYIIIEEQQKLAEQTQETQNDLIKASKEASEIEASMNEIFENIQELQNTHIIELN